MPAIRDILVSSALLALLQAAGANPIGDSLRLGSEPDGWSRWQARLAVVSAPLNAPGSGQPVWALGAARLSTDRFFDIGRLGDGGGLRATSALLLGPRSLALGATPTGQGSSSVWRSSALLDGAPDFSATPYVGLGYSAWWNRAGVGVSADLGLMAQRAGQGLRALSGGSGLDNTVRAMQLSPVFQLNLSYAF